MALGDVFRLTRTVVIDGQYHVNVMHFRDTDGSSDTPEEDLMDHWDSSAQAGCPENKLRGLIRGYTSLEYIGLTAQKISPTKGEIVGRQIITDPDPASDSGLLTFSQTKFTFTTDRQDRSGRGGIYVGGIPEQSTNGNLVTASYTVLQQALVNAIIAFFTAAGSDFANWVIGVWSEKLKEFNEVTAITVAADIGTMRSRRLGRGV